ncbi:hypothetical protein B0J14DRAFT_572434 [Halenospora varia]|nr:hypothetical protein B0J14DRAFT_572434 [Halenospora varia]
MRETNIPFSKADELYSKLEISESGTQLIRVPPSKKVILPNQPRIELTERELINSFLQKELTTPDLDTFHSYLWLVGTQSSSHISALTKQAVRGRKIIVTENPEIHLTWINSTVYIKPIPKYVLSHAFWEFYFTSKSSPLNEEEKITIGNAARGFLRSYAYLIQHKSDFIVAKKLNLIPKHVKHSQFIKFIIMFERLQDDEVSLRYSFGELRLGRLNFWAVFALHRWEFHKHERQTGAYFAQFYGPILFIFGIFATLLNAMQVGLAVQSLQASEDSWETFKGVSRVFSIITLVAVVLVIFVLLVLFLARALMEIQFALRDKMHKRRMRRSS